MLVRIQALLWLERGTGWLAGLISGVVVSAAANLLSQADRLYLVLGVVLAGLIGLGGRWLRGRRGVEILIDFKPPTQLESPAKCAEYARRGFIGFAPLYRPNDGSPAAGLSVAERLQAARNFDFAALDLEHSNMAPTIYAIACHASRLQHCWLLPTVQARPYVTVLVEYLRQRKGLRCQFHYVEDRYLIPAGNEALIFNETYELICRVRQEARALGLGVEDIVADMSTGVRSTTLGMVLASLGENQDLEFVSTVFDDTGRPTDMLLPLVFHFKPQVA